MAVEKRSVSIDSDLWAQLEQVAAGRPASAILNDALRMYLWRLDVASFISEYEAEHGAITEEERAAARAELAAAMADPALKSTKGRARAAAPRKPGRRPVRT
jgi:hypothetical protein